MVSSPQIAWVRVKYSNIMLFLAFMEKFLSADSKIPWHFWSCCSLSLIVINRLVTSIACELIKTKYFIQRIKIRLNDENVATHLHLLMF